MPTNIVKYYRYSTASIYEWKDLWNDEGETVRGAEKGRTEESGPDLRESCDAAKVCDIMSREIIISSFNMDTFYDASDWSTEIAVICADPVTETSWKSTASRGGSFNRHFSREQLVRISVSEIIICRY